MVRVTVSATVLLSFFASIWGIGTADAAPGEVLWSAQRGTRIDGSPAYAGDGTVYVGSDDDFLYAIDGADGTEKWRFETGGDIFSSPASGADGTIYVGSDDGFLYAVTPDGEELWRFEIGDLARVSPAIGPDGTVYVGAGDGVFYALDAEDGTPEWEFPAGGPVFSDPSIDDGGTADDFSDDVVYFGSDDGNLYALNTQGDDRERWTYKAGGPIRTSPAIGADGTVYVGSDDGRLYALDPEADDADRLRWFYETQGAIRSSAALAGDGTIYFGSRDGLFYALNPEDGAVPRVRWSFDIGSAIDSSPAVGSDGTVYFGARNARLYAFDSDGTQKWAATIRDTFSSPLIDPDGTLYIGSRSEGSTATTGGRLYAVETDSAGPSDRSAWAQFGHDVRRTGRNSENRGPTADAGEDRTVVDGEGVVLDGSGSTDPDFGIADYAWRQTDGPSVDLTEEGRTGVRFVAPGEQDAATLVFELTVTDIGGKSSADTVSVTVEENSAFCFLGGLIGGSGESGRWLRGVWSAASILRLRGKRGT